MKGQISPHARQDGSIVPGSWHLRIELPRGADGKRRQKKVTFKGTQRAAEKEWARLQADANAGALLPATKETVESYVGAWLKKRAADGISPRTLETWGTMARAYVIPQLGKIPLEKLTPRQVEEFYTFLRSAARVRGKGGLSGRSVHHVHRFLSQVMKSAVRLEMIPKNPTEWVGPRAVKPPARKHVAKFTGAALRALYAAVEGTWLYVPVVLATGMGLRRGEVLALKWERVDFKTGVLEVSESLQQLNGCGLFTKAPKTEDSERENTMPEFVAEMLRKHKGEQAAHRLQVGEAWTDQGYVVADGFGNPRTPAALTNGFARMMERLVAADPGLPDLTFHDLRHVCATVQLLMGVPLKVVSKRLGHANIGITADLYAHVLQELDEQAAQKTDEYLRRALGE
jgi:integrase